MSFRFACFIEICLSIGKVICHWWERTLLYILGVHQKSFILLRHYGNNQCSFLFYGFVEKKLVSRSSQKWIPPPPFVCLSSYSVVAKILSQPGSLLCVYYWGINYFWLYNMNESFAITNALRLFNCSCCKSYIRVSFYCSLLIYTDQLRHRD